MKRILISLLILAAIISSHTGAASTAGLLFNVSVAGKTVTVSPTIPNHVYAAAGIKINTSGYTLTNPGTECSMADNGFCLFSVSSATPKALSITGNSGNLNITLCLNGTGRLSCQNYIVTIRPNPTAGPLAYVSGFGDTVSVCDVNTTGALSNCFASDGGGVFNGAFGIVLNPARTFAYVTNYFAAPGTLAICALNQVDGRIINCNLANLGNTVTPAGIVLNATATLAFIANQNNNNLSRCIINPNGSLNSCTVVNPDNTFQEPQGLTYNPAHTRIYVSNYINSTVSMCTLNPDETLNSCVAANPGLNFVGPRGITFNTLGTRLYVANSDNNTVSICTLNPNGTLNSCNATNPGGVLDLPIDIKINAAGSLAYIVNANQDQVLACSINSNNGQLSNCTPTGGQFATPTSIFLTN